MKGKQLASLLGLVAVVGGVGYYLNKDSQKSWNGTGTSSGGKVLNLSLNDVARVTVKATGAEMNLVKKDDVWTVQERANYPANFEQVSGLIRKVWEMKTVQEVKVGSSQFARMELVEPGKGEGAGTLLEFKDKDGKDLGALILGKKQMRKGDDGMEALGGGGGFAVGRHVLPVGTTKVSLVSDALEDVNTKAESWLKRDFFKMENVTSITLDGPTDAQKWKVSRESATTDWKLDGAKPEEALDASKVNPIASTLASPSFADVMAPDAKPDETGLDKPSTVTFETADKFTYAVKIGKAVGENYPVTVAISAALPKERTPGKDEKPEDKAKLDGDFAATQKRLEEKLANEKKFEARPYLIAKGTIDQLLKDRASLLAEKKPETPPAGAPGEGASIPPGIALPPGLTPPPKPTAPISVTTPPVTVSPATATTPPVAAPVLPKDKPVPPGAPENKPVSPAAPENKPAPPVAPPEKPSADEKKPTPAAAEPQEKPAPPAAPESKPAAPQ